MRFIARFLSRIGRGENWTENRDTFPLFFVACYCCCCFCQQSFADTICLRQSLVYSIYTYIFLHIYISLLQSDSSPFGCFHLPTDVATFMVDVITFLLLPPLMPCFPISLDFPLYFPSTFPPDWYCGMQQHKKLKVEDNLLARRRVQGFIPWN